MSLVKNTTWICFSVFVIATSVYWVWVMILLAPVVLTIGAGAVGYYLYSFIEVVVVQPPEVVALELISLTTEFTAPVSAVLVTASPEEVTVVAV
ncbi:MAG: hypothetical protein ACK5RO_06140 [Pseudobdellovibrionaceae bacterium]